MVASTSVPLSSTAQEAFIQYYRSTQEAQNTERAQRRQDFECIDRAYQREVQDLTEAHERAKAANAAGDADKFQNVTIPVVMPQVETSVSYQTSVFLTGEPIFGVVSAPEFMDAALQMQSVITEQSIKGGWTRDLLLFFRDGAKYNFAPMELKWVNEVSYTVETDITKSSTEGIPKQVIWSGNDLNRLDPYNTFVDNTVLPTQVYKDGEYAGYTDFMSRMKLKAFIASLPDRIVANIKPAFESGLATAPATNAVDSKGYYRPTVNPEKDYSNNRGELNWMTWAELTDSGNKIHYRNGYEVTTLYARILPSEFDLKLPNSNTPQIFKLIIINHQVIIYAERQTNAHNIIPIFIGQPLEDGLGYQTKSLAENGTDFQDLTSSYMNSIIHSRRRSVTDRLLYDSSRVLAAHINSKNPSAKIPVRPSAQGTKISDAVYQFPFRDEQTAMSMQQISALLGMANGLAGQNQANQGQFVKGNKTLHEFESVMQSSNGRDQMSSILTEAQVLVPMKQAIKTNILQFQGGTSIYNKDAKKVIEIDPVTLRQAILDFRISDGLIPSSKIINAESYSVAMQVMGSSPQINSQYNIGPMFSYLMKTQGADISDFEKSPEQVAYEQALQAWQQTVALLIDKSQEVISQEDLPPQPVPQEFGYNPQNSVPQPSEATAEQA